LKVPDGCQEAASGRTVGLQSGQHILTEWFGSETPDRELPHAHRIIELRVLPATYGHHIRLGPSRRGQDEQRNLEPSVPRAHPYPQHARSLDVTVSPRFLPPKHGLPLPGHPPLANHTRQNRTRGNGHRTIWREAGDSLRLPLDPRGSSSHFRQQKTPAHAGVWIVGGGGGIGVPPSSSLLHVRAASAVPPGRTAVAFLLRRHCCTFVRPLPSPQGGRR